MFRGLFRLTWLEIKIFVREPLGLIGTVAVPVLLFAWLGRIFGSTARPADPDVPRFVGESLPVLAAVLIMSSAVLSLVAIVAIYRESGILKRLRATPLRPQTILGAHVTVKLLFSAATLGLTIAAGWRRFPVEGVPLGSFAVALIFATFSILSLGFVIASIVPTARFAQPIATLIVYPMIALSGLFVPIEMLPPGLQVIARALPLTYAVSLLRGVWRGEGWLTHLGDVAILTVGALALTAVSARIFRWE
jgi:ABC-2 type transport system permease protein